MITLDELRDSVDPARGEVAFAVPVGALEGGPGPAVTLALSYNSNVRRTVTSWNLTDPTGVAGLGWSLPIDRIVVDFRGAASFADDDLYLVTGGVPNRLVRTGTDPSDSSWTYALEGYEFWHIRRYVSEERWVIVDADGTTHTYGDDTGGVGTVEWGVAWGNWLGSSGETADQRRIATAWNLSTVADLWGNTVNYGYDQATAAVGGSAGLEHTQATYLARIVAADGFSLELVYGDKTADEFQDPHTDPVPPNAWQDRFQTKFLEEVRFQTPGGDVMSTVDLDYGSPDFLGTGSMTKRLLRGVSTRFPSGAQLPGVTFEYATDATGDSWLGAMSAVTVPEGGRVSFTYADTAVGVSSRDVQLVAPTSPAGSYTLPRVYFDRDYAVTTWFESGATAAQVTAYTWAGRWLPATDLGTIALGDASAYGDVQVATSDNCFAVSANRTVVVQYRDPRIDGTWIGTPESITLDLTPGEPTQTACGEGFAAVLGLRSGKLNVVTWDGSTWTAQPVTTPIGSDISCAMDARRGHLVVASATSTGTDSIDVAVMYLDAMRTWQRSSFSVERGTTVISTLEVVAGDAFAVVARTGPVGPRTRLVLDAINWSPEHNGLTASRLMRELYPTPAEVPAATVHGSTVFTRELAFRFDGVAWQRTDLSRIDPIVGANLDTTSYAADTVLRRRTLTDGSLVLDLLAYDPNKSGTAAAWSQAVRNAIPAGSVVADAARSKDGPSRFAIVGTGTPAAANSIYFQHPNATWTATFAVPDQLTAAELPSLQLLAERYCIYQSSSNTVVYFLRNGTTGADLRSSATGAILVPNDVPSALVGETAFATYTGTWDGADAVITLHRVVTDGISGPQTATTVTGSTVDMGYTQIARAFSYDSPTAVMVGSGSRAGFNAVTTTDHPVIEDPPSQGSTTTFTFNNLLPADGVAPVQPYPTGPATNAEANLSLVQGQVYASAIDWIDGIDGGARQNTTTQYVHVTEQQLTSGTGPVGFYVRGHRAVAVTDGVTTDVTTRYNSNGLPSSVATDRFDSLGRLEPLTETFVYFPETYPGGDPVNLLSPVVQTTSTSNGVAIASTVTTWRKGWDQSSTNWAADATYVADAAGFAEFDAWQPGAPVPNGWALAEEVVARTPQGEVMRSVDVLGRTTSALYDRSDDRVVASFGNADTAAAEASYYGFEAYERNPDWDYIGQGTLADHIVDTQAHTGMRSFELVADAQQQNGPTATLLHSTDDRAYVFGCWMLTPVGFTPSTDESRWEFQVYDTSQPTVPVATLYQPFPEPDDGRWQYVFAVIDLGRVRAAHGIAASVPLSVTVFGYNQQAGSPACYIDDVRFSPVDATFEATVYDPSTYLPTATLGENGATMRPVRNDTLRTITTIGPDENVGPLAIPAFARDMSADGSFDPKLPNSVVDVRSTGDGLYFDFDQSDVPAWGLPGDWSIADHTLRYAGSQNGPIGADRAILKHRSGGSRTDFEASRYACRVRADVVRPVPTELSIAIGTGNVFVSWQPEPHGGEWRLWHADGDPPTMLASRDGDFGSDWLFAILDQLVLFYVNGVQVFAFELDASITPATQLQLTATRAAFFEELVVDVDPLVAMRFLDGAGAPIQQIQLADDNVVMATGFVPDLMGRPAYEKDPVDSTLRIAPPPGGGASAGPESTATDSGPDQTRTIAQLGTYLPIENGTQLTVAQYKDASISGAPYTRTVFEASPMARPIEIGSPGIDYTIGSGHTTTIQRGANVVDGIMDGLLPAGAPGLAAGSYHVTSTTDPDGNVRDIVLDKTGRVVATKLTPAQGQPGSPTPIVDLNVYDGLGNVIEERSPNYYDPPQGSDPTTWRRTNTYTFRGRLASSTRPDWGTPGNIASQTAQYLYDSAQRLRFVLDPAGAALSPARIIYYTYDALDRVVEQGTVAQHGLTWAGVAQYADQTGWPDDTVTGAIWHRRFVYDLVPTTSVTADQPDDLIGRLYQVQTNTSGVHAPASFETETYAYDRRGRVLHTTTGVPDFDDNRYRSFYAYDDLDQIRRITYPRALDENGQPVGDAVEVSYAHDRLGRLEGVGTPTANGQNRFAKYTYDEAGLVGTETFNPDDQVHAVTRALTYDTAGLLTNVDGDYYSEKLTFGTGGSGGSTNYRRQATSVESTYHKLKRNSGFDEPPLSTDAWTYSYDGSGRLVVAEARAGTDDASLDLGGTGAPVVYDANGNLTTVPRTPSTESYDYGSGTPSVPQNDQVQRVVGQTTSTLTFGGDDRRGWSFGASNGGPSTSHVVPAGQENATPAYLRLGGGSIGHYETLRFVGWLDPAGSYTLRFRWRAPDPFGQQTGRAGWYLRLLTADGTEYDAAVDLLTTGSADWTDSPDIPVDVGQVASAAGLGGNVTAVSLVLLNAKRAADGTSGAPIDVESVSLTTASAGPPTRYTYDPNGNVAAAPPRGITGIDYEPVTGLTALITMEQGDLVKSVALSNGPDGRTRSSTVTLSDDSTEKTLFLPGPGGRPLTTITTDATGTTQTRYLHGRDGLLGTFAESAPYVAQYVLKDHLGSARVLVSEPPSFPVQTRYEYAPFGEVTRRVGTSPYDYRYTGQRVDRSTGLVDYGARMYDARLRRFYGVDAIARSGSPYAYVEGDPIDRIDPTGDDWLHALANAGALGVGLVALSVLPPLPTSLVLGVAIAGSAVNIGWTLARDPTALVLPLALGPFFTRALAPRDPYVPGYRRGWGVGLALTARNLIVGAAGVSLSFGSLGAIEAGAKAWARNETVGDAAWEGARNATIAGLQWYGARSVSSAVIGELTVVAQGGRLQATWNNLHHQVVRKQYLLDTGLNPVQKHYIFGRVLHLKNQIKTFLRPGGMHEWFEVGMYDVTGGNYGMLVAQIQAEVTPTATNPMFRYNGVNWAHAYNAAHRFNTRLLFSSPSAFTYEFLRWANGLVAPGVGGAPGAVPQHYALLLPEALGWQLTG